MKVAIALIALVAVAAALPTDPIAWSFPVENSATLPAQLSATNDEGSLVVTSGSNLVSLDFTTGNQLWAVPADLINASNGVIYALSSTVLLTVTSANVSAFSLKGGRLIGTTPTSLAYTSILVHQDYFILAGDGFLTVFASDFTQRYTVSPQANTATSTIGATSGFLYYTLENIGTSGSAAAITELVIVDMTTWNEKTVANILTASPTGTNGFITVIFAQNPVVGYLNVRTAEFRWQNSAIAATLQESTSFSFIASSDVPMVVAGSQVFAFDAQDGSSVFNVTSSVGAIISPIIAAGRLVFASSAGSTAPLGIMVADLSTGNTLGNYSVPTLATPAPLVAAGSNFLVVNGQGYSRLSAITGLPVAYNLNVAGTGGAIVIPGQNASTFVLLGQVEVAAVVIPNA